MSEAAALEVALSNGAVLVRNDAIDPPSYEYSYTVTDNDEESETPLVATVTATDVAGNASSASLDFNAFDFTPPVLLDSNLNHLLLRSGEIFRVTFELNEPSVTVPEMVAVMDETTIALVGEAVGDTGWSFRHTVLEGQDGTYALTLQNVSDAAGNAMAAVDLGSVVFDGTPPFLTSELNSPHLPGDTVRNRVLMRWLSLSMFLSRCCPAKCKCGF